MADDERGGEGGGGEYEWGRRHEVEARLGCVHEARNVGTGTPALALVPREDVEWRPEGPCQLRVSYAPERDAVMVDVERAPAAVRTSELTNLLVLVTAVFKRVEDDEAVEAHLASGPVRSARRERPRAVRASRWGMAAAGVAGLAAGLGVWFAAEALAPSDATDCSWAVENALLREMDFVDLDKPEVETLAYKLPEKPWTKQAVAPCETDRGEVEINKGCWIALDKRPPCYSNHAEYQGKCYMPVRKPEPVPQSAQP